MPVHAAKSVPTLRYNADIATLRVEFEYEKRIFFVSFPKRAFPAVRTAEIYVFLAGEFSRFVVSHHARAPSNLLLRGSQSQLCPPIYLALQPSSTFTRASVQHLFTRSRASPLSFPLYQRFRASTRLLAVRSSRRPLIHAQTCSLRRIESTRIFKNLTPVYAAACEIHSI